MANRSGRREQRKVSSFVRRSSGNAFSDGMHDAYAINAAKTEFRESYNADDVERLLVHSRWWPDRLLVAGLEPATYGLCVVGFNRDYH